MALSASELHAGIRILVGVARADGRLRPEERAAIEGAMGALPEEERAGVGELLASEVDLELELGRLESEESRRAVYEAALVVARSDGDTSAAETAIIERLRPEDHEASLLDQVLGETRDTFSFSSIEPVSDDEQRSVEIDEDILKYAILSGVLGALPVPGVTIVTDLAVIGLQVKLVRDIGQYWGHKVDGQAARSLLGSVAGSAGLRVAVNNLARLVPGWGSVFGAVSSFASTWAIGKVANEYFESGGQGDVGALRERYEQARAEGESAYAAHTDKVEEARQAHGTRLEMLARDLEQGRISREQYERSVQELGHS